MQKLIFGEYIWIMNQKKLTMIAKIITFIPNCCDQNYIWPQKIIVILILILILISGDHHESAKKLYCCTLFTINRTAEIVDTIARREKRKKFKQCHSFFSKLADFPLTCDNKQVKNKEKNENDHTWIKIIRLRFIKKVG